MTEPTLRLATPDDASAISELIAVSARGLCVGDYTTAQVEAALAGAWGCDSELIRDGTYFVFVAGGAIVACGGWGRRRTLFGGDKQPGRVSELLDPARDDARIRAFFVHPDWSRRGLARELLAKCEAEALAAGFRATELLATLTGVRFYAHHSYTGSAEVEYPLPGGEVIRFVPMRKMLGENS
jgi:GNAT superfamily N-acetyltransferase